MNARTAGARVLLLVTALAASQTADLNSGQAADWNQWRGAQRDGVAHDCPPLVDRLPKNGLKPVWRINDLDPLKSGGWSSPIVARGRVYLFAHKRTKVGKDQLPKAKFPYLPPEKRTGMSDAEYEQYEQNRRDEQEQRARNYRFDEVVICLDADSGKPVWNSKWDSVYTRFSQSGSPAVVDGRVYVLGAGRQAHCLSAEDGKQLWTTKLPGPFRDEFLQSSFAVADGVAVVSCGALVGLDTKSGQIRWTVGNPLNKALHTSPVVWRDGDASRVIANLDGTETVCVDPGTGHELWRIESQAGHSTPVVVQDRLLTYGNSRKKGLRCFALRSDRCEPLWVYQGAADPGSSPVVVGDHVYVQGERRLACVDLKTGKAAWTTLLNLNRPRYTSLVAADNRVIYAFDGVLGFAADPTSFQTWMNAKIDSSGLLAEVETFRQSLDMAKLEKTAAGQQEAERLWRRTFNNAGPLPCASPAIADGRLYLRLKSGVACYDLTTR